MIDIDSIRENSKGMGFYFLPILDPDFIKDNEQYEIILKSGIKLFIFKKSFFYLDFSNYLLLENMNATEKKENYSRYPMISNCFLACLYSAIAKVQNYITPIEVNLDLWNRFMSNHESEFNVLNIGYHACVKNRLEQQMPFSFKLETLSYAISNFEKICTDKNKYGFLELNTLYQAHHYYRNHDYSNGLLLGWLSLEKMISQLYDEFLIAVKKTDSKRADKLSDQRSFSAAIKVEILYEKAMISKGEYLKIEKMRKLRNNWAHSLSMVKAADASECLGISNQFFNRIYETDLALAQPMNERY